MAQDLRDIYRKQMRHHGCGMAMYQPIAHKDIEPPCCGYFDQNGKWNLIANLKSRGALSKFGLTPLRREPLRMQQIGLRWQPKCSKGVRKINIDLSGQTPDLSVPVSADAHIKYQSKKRFGAVLVARNPITLTAYNDESLFKEWIEDNKARLYELFSHQLKKYGLWVITTTYTAPGCSINAWMDSKTDAVLSAKAQADMAGEFGAELDWTDKLTDKDWCHYTAKPVGMLRGSKDGSSLKSSTRRMDSRKPGSRSRSPDTAASSVNSILVTPQQSSSLEPASSDGVVMFYNGHYADQLEWWVAGAKSVSTSIFGTKLGDAIEDAIPERHSHLSSGAAQCNTCIRVQSLAHKDDMRYSTHGRDAKPTLSSDDSFEVEYDPEKDEGVHPRYWPPRNPSLRASRQVEKLVHSVDASLEHTDLGSGHRQSRGDRIRRDGVPCGDKGISAG